MTFSQSFSAWEAGTCMSKDLKLYQACFTLLTEQNVAELLFALHTVFRNASLQWSKM